ncbi:MAG: YceI family protein [Bdellovibrionaceae bacterium]|nr:YceI family protein [Pseudobdellovibrionaceae bacterium]
MKYPGFLFPILVLSFLLHNQSVFANGSVEIDVKLSPAGSFKAQTKKVQGRAYRNGDDVVAENIIVDLKNLSTGVGLRDKHLKEHLMVEKYPEAKLVKATGKGGKGVASLIVKGKNQKVEGTYKVKGDTLVAEFPMTLSATDINDVRYMGVGVKDEVIVHVNVPISDGPMPHSEDHSSAGDKKQDLKKKPKGKMK